MHERKHLSLVGPRIFLDSVGTERLGRAATALVQRRNKAGICLHFLQLLWEVTHLGYLILRVEGVRVFQPKDVLRIEGTENPVFTWGPTFGPNIFISNEPRWSRGRTYKSLSKPRVIMMPP